MTRFLEFLADSLMADFGWYRERRPDTIWRHIAEPDYSGWSSGLNYWAVDGYASPTPLKD